MMTGGSAGFGAKSAGGAYRPTFVSALRLVCGRLKNVDLSLRDKEKLSA